MASLSVKLPTPSTSRSDASANQDATSPNEPSTSGGDQAPQRRHSGEPNQNGLSDIDENAGEIRFHSSPSLGARNQMMSSLIPGQRRVRRGAVSGEVYTEEDAASYIKKVILSSLILTLV